MIQALNACQRTPSSNALGDLHQHAATHLTHLTYLTSCVGVQQSKQLLWGWYTLRYHPPDALLEAIAKRLTSLVHNMDARTLSEFIWAFGGLNYEPSNMQLFLQVCLSHAPQTLSHCSIVFAAWLFMLQGLLTCLASCSCLRSSACSSTRFCPPYAAAQLLSMLCMEDQQLMYNDTHIAAPHREAQYTFTQSFSSTNAKRHSLLSSFCHASCGIKDTTTAVCRQLRTAAGK